MNVKQLHALTLRETDVQSAIRRCCDSEQLYASCLKLFLEDSTIADLNKAVKNKSWDAAFTAAHALKGLAGNMGFVPLMHSTGQLVVLIRGGRVSDLAGSLEDVNSCYRDITDAVREYFASADADSGASSAASASAATDIY